MGAAAEVNSLVRLDASIDIENLSVGQVLELTKDQQRVFPVGKALLMVDDNWIFYGYCRIVVSSISERATDLTIEVLSLFDPEERELYHSKFREAGRQTGEVTS